MGNQKRGADAEAKRLQPEATLPFENVTKYGYKVLERYMEPDGRLVVLAALPDDSARTKYVIAGDYNEETGTWIWGRYSNTLEDIVEKWNVIRGLGGKENALVLSEPFDTRSMAVPVKDGYLVATASIPTFPEEEVAVSLGFYNLSGEWIHDFAIVSCMDDGEYVGHFSKIGETGSMVQSFDSKDIARFGVNPLSKHRSEYVKLPDRSGHGVNQPTRRERRGNPA